MKAPNTSTPPPPPSVHRHFFTRWKPRCAVVSLVRYYFCSQARVIERNNRKILGQELARAGTGAVDASSIAAQQAGRVTMDATERRLRNEIEANRLAREQASSVVYVLLHIYSLPRRRFILFYCLFHCMQVICFVLFVLFCFGEGGQGYYIFIYCLLRGPSNPERHFARGRMNTRCYYTTDGEQGHRVLVLSIRRNPQRLQ